VSLHAEGDFLFPVTGVDLASDERKLYYKELVSFAREELVGIPEGYLQYLKELFFKGTTSVDPWVAFRASSPLFICLCAPSISREFVIDTFDSYDHHCAYYDVEHYRMHIFGKAEQKWPMVVGRLESVVEYLADDRSQCTNAQKGGLRSHYLSIYYKIFYRYRSGGVTRASMAHGVIAFVERNFEEIKLLGDSGGTMVALHKIFPPIFSGKITCPDKAYLDPILLGFLNRFFTKQLPPTLQAIAEEVYAKVEHPIQLVDGRVIY